MTNQASAPKPDLKLAYCDHRAATFAVMNWHYSKVMPVGKLVKIGVWEDGDFIGAVIYGLSNSWKLGQAWGAGPKEFCELTRVALKSGHKSPTSQIVAISIKMLKKQSPGLKLIVSFADPVQGHHGGIYQAMNWIYVGPSVPLKQYFYNGKWQHSRSIAGGRFGSAGPVEDYTSLPKRIMPAKHRYLYPLDRQTRKRLLPLAQPYPQREGESIKT